MQNQIAIFLYNFTIKLSSLRIWQNAFLQSYTSSIKVSLLSFLKLSGFVIELTILHGGLGNSVEINFLIKWEWSDKAALSRLTSISSIFTPNSIQALRIVSSWRRGSIWVKWNHNWSWWEFSKQFAFSAALN